MKGEVEASVAAWFVLYKLIQVCTSLKKKKCFACKLTAMRWYVLQDVLIQFLTTDEIKLNVIDAEDPEVSRKKRLISLTRTDCQADSKPSVLLFIYFFVKWME